MNHFEYVVYWNADVVCMQYGYNLQVLVCHNYYNFVVIQRVVIYFESNI